MSIGGKNINPSSFSFLMVMFSLMLLLLMSLFPLTEAAVLGNCYTTRLHNLKQKKSKVRGVNFGGLDTVDPELISVLYNTDESSDSTNAFLASTFQINTTLLNGSSLPTLTLFQWTAAIRNLGLNATDLLLTQWRYYFNELNFALISRANLNSIRINLGWWTIYNGNTLAAPYGYSGGDLSFLDQAFKWANKYGIGILLDLHHLAGQSETDSSTMWNSTNVALSQKALRALVTRYATKPALLGVQVANDPIYGASTQTNYYNTAYNIVRSLCATCLVVIASAGETLLPTFMVPPKFSNVWTETPLTINTQSTVVQGANSSNVTKSMAVVVTSWTQDINTYASANNLDRKGRPLLIGAWTGKGIVNLLQGSLPSTGMMQQFLLQQRQALSASKNAGWFYDKWSQSPSINGTASPSYLSALQLGMISVNDVFEDTNSCPPPYLCNPSYTQNNYLKAVGQCGQCGTAALLKAAGVVKTNPSSMYQRIGCYQDNVTSSDLLFRFSVPGLTLEICNSLCTTFLYFAVQSDGVTSLCSCGDFYGSYGQSSACTLPCPGNSTEICGGPLANNVFKRKTSEVICNAIP